MLFLFRPGSELIVRGGVVPSKIGMAPKALLDAHTTVAWQDVIAKLELKSRWFAIVAKLRAVCER